MATTYPPANQCIYCGALETEETPLRPEHIIAFALNGDTILPKASCDPCGKLTGRIEEANTRHLGLFAPMRYTHRMKSRQRSKWPKSLPVTVEGDNGLKVVADVPVAEFPATIALPILPEAGWLNNQLGDGKTVVLGWWVWSQHDKIAKLLSKLGILRGTIITGETNPTKFSQMLAKIGHSAAAAHFGIDDFTPMAVDLALGRSADFNHLVGISPLDWPIPPAEEALHDIRFDTGQSPVIIAEIRLFASLGAPRYHVVVGVEKN